MYIDLVQVIWEMGLRQAMFNLNTHGPNDERFMTHIKDLILDAAPHSSGVRLPGSHFDPFLRSLYA